MKTEHKLFLHQTLSKESIGCKEYFYVEGNDASIEVALKMCPKLAAHQKAFKEWLNSFGPNYPSFSFMSWKTPACSISEIKELLKKVV